MGRGLSRSVGRWLLVAAVGLFVGGQDAQAATEAQKRARAMKALRAWLAVIERHHSLPSLCARLVTDEPHQSYESGFANHRMGVAATTETLYETASLMKPMTACALLCELQAQGSDPSRQASDDFNETLDDLQGEEPARSLEVLEGNVFPWTYADLLSHNVSVGPGVQTKGLYLWTYEMEQSLWPWRDRMARTIVQPAGGTGYVNDAYDVAGYLLATRLGQSHPANPYAAFEAALAEHVWSRLDMHETCTALPADAGELLERMAIPYMVPDGVEPEAKQPKRYYNVGGIQGYTSVDDLSRFLAAHLNPNDAEPHVGASARLMQEPLFQGAGALDEAGLGWQHYRHGGLALVWHAGMGAAMTGLVAGDVHHRVGMAVLTNSAGQGQNGLGNALQRAAGCTVTAYVGETGIYDFPAGSTTAIEGVYASADGDLQVEVELVTVTGGGPTRRVLVLSVPASPSVPRDLALVMRPDAAALPANLPWTFDARIGRFGERATVTFRTDAAGAQPTLELAATGTHPVRTWVRVPPNNTGDEDPVPAAFRGLWKGTMLEPEAGTTHLPSRLPSAAAAPACPPSGRRSRPFPPEPEPVPPSVVEVELDLTEGAEGKIGTLSFPGRGVGGEPLALVRVRGERLDVAVPPSRLFNAKWLTLTKASEDVLVAEVQQGSLRRELRMLRAPPDAPAAVTGRWRGSALMPYGQVRLELDATPGGASFLAKPTCAFETMSSDSEAAPRFPLQELKAPQVRGSAASTIVELPAAGRMHLRGWVGLRRMRGGGSVVRWSGLLRGDQTSAGFVLERPATPADFPLHAAGNLVPPPAPAPLPPPEAPAPAPCAPGPALR